MLVCLYSMNCYARKNQPVNRIFDGARERVTVQKQSPYEGKTEGDREEDGVIDEEGDTSHRKGESMRAEVLLVVLHIWWWEDEGVTRCVFSYHQTVK